MVAASGGASQDSGSYCRPVASVNSGAQWNRSHRCLQPSTHGEGGLPVRTRRVVMDDFAMLGRGRLVTDRGRCSLRTTCPVLQVVLLVGPDAGGEEGVRLQPEELRPGRADPAGRWAEASPSEHRGDGRCRDIDPELQELAPDPEVAPSGILPSQTKDQLLDRGISSLIEGSTGGRPGRRDRRRRPTASSRCHRTSVSRPTRKLFRRSGERSRAAAARNARSAVVNRGRTPPRLRIFS